ncbi:Ribosomal protein S29 [Spironucleus salmonicida]|uniref:Ribosomal protein S29 n=1 Tax=Spironucleus salmonicida TaxID=348837 RepID=V6M710_9EUKA|nr:Ribosomal protein S29 [Spironucleus salmonicida]|eukprot:EST49199.1 Ribosomal protein S29A [Spironucleus salmonicida]
MARDAQFSAHHIEHTHCRVCGNENALVNKYSLCICRRCFRENAAKIGFVKYH